MKKSVWREKGIDSQKHSVKLNQVYVSPELLELNDENDKVTRVKIREVIGKSLKNVKHL